MNDTKTGLETSAVLEIPQADQRLTSGRHNVTMQFAGAEWAILADGCGGAYIVATGDRARPEASWQVAPLF